MDRSGQIIWYLNQFNDPYGILAAGDPLTVSKPTDVQFYLQNTVDASNVVTGYEAHYLIADSGNNRIVEVVDYYDAKGQIRQDLSADGKFTGGLSGEHVAVFTTHTASNQGRALQFQSVQRIAPVFAGATQSAPVLVALIGNVSASGATTTPTGTPGWTGPATSDFTGGSLVQINYVPFGAPAISGSPIWQPAAGVAPVVNEPRGNGTLGLVFNSFVTLSGGNVAANQRIVGPTYFQAISMLDPTVAAGSSAYINVYLVCDARGVYGLKYNPGVSGPTPIAPRLEALWTFTPAEYDKVFKNRLSLAVGAPFTAPNFVPTSVQRLASGHYLITNNYSGEDPWFVNGRFLGETFEIAPPAAPATATTDTVTTGWTYGGFASPNIVSDSGGKYRQVMGTSAGNASLMEQPRFAGRQ